MQWQSSGGALTKWVSSHRQPGLHYLPGSPGSPPRGLSCPSSERRAPLSCGSSPQWLVHLHVNKSLMLPSEIDTQEAMFLEERGIWQGEPEKVGALRC